jgi:transketolase
MESRDQVIPRIMHLAQRMRRHVLDMALSAGATASHLGGGLSCVDIAATLYGAVMKIDAQNPEGAERDRFILSKGHGVLAHYAALAEAGFIPVAELQTFEKSWTDLLGHPVINRKKGIEFSNGSLGMGLSLGIGVALPGKKRNRQYKVYVVMGDGECNEGSVWEAAMAAGNYKLDNLVGIIDRNNFQQTGSNLEIMSSGDVAAKFAAFGWEAKEIDGHNIGEIYDTLSLGNSPGRPLAIVAHTVKGKGFSFSENNNAWHHAALSKSQYEAALAELDAVAAKKWNEDQ